MKRNLEQILPVQSVYSFEGILCMYGAYLSIEEVTHSPAVRRLKYLTQQPIDHKGVSVS